jgi:hypothetical protein
MKNIILTIIFIQTFSLVILSQCDTYTFQSIELGEVFINLEALQKLKICEGEGIITAGSETFYIQKAYVNEHQEFVYDIQEAQGYWPTIGFVKISKDFSLAQVKFMSSIVTYRVTTP